MTQKKKAQETRLIKSPDFIEVAGVSQKNKMAGLQLIALDHGSQSRQTMADQLIHGYGMTCPGEMVEEDSCRLTRHLKDSTAGRPAGDKAKAKR